MTMLDRETLHRFLDLAGDRLAGDWVVMGGIVLPLLGIEHRVTYDIDIAGPDTAGNDQTYALMEIAESLGLPVETINQAGAFFLRRIAGWRKALMPLHRGKRATIHRPNVTLYLLLKIDRMTESDLADCLALLDFTRTRDESPDVQRILQAVRAARGRGVSLDKDRRLQRLTDAIV